MVRAPTEALEIRGAENFGHLVQAAAYQQNGFGVEWKAEFERCLHRDEDAVIHHLERGRDDACADNAADRLRGIVDRVKHGQHRAVALRIARQAHPNPGDDGKRALAADNRADQIGPG